MRSAGFYPCFYTDLHLQKQWKNRGNHAWSKSELFLPCFQKACMIRKLFTNTKVVVSLHGCFLPIFLFHFRLVSGQNVHQPLPSIQIYIFIFTQQTKWRLVVDILSTTSFIDSNLRIPFYNRIFIHNCQNGSYVDSQTVEEIKGSKAHSMRHVSSSNTFVISIQVLSRSFEYRPVPLRPDSRIDTVAGTPWIHPNQKSGHRQN